jgi:lipopolysaccharide/colanic/teichoic acid biosynthesis glycosyltransferase
VTPGLTGLAQVNSCELKPEEKIVYDVQYIETRSLSGDLKILFGTVALIFK